jgi:hypothetical protein
LQVTPQWPFEQAVKVPLFSQVLHVTPQAPQLLLSVCGLTHLPLQTIWPAAQDWHVPTWQSWPEAQTLPQAPQFCGSLVVFTHVTYGDEVELHAVYPVLQETPHFPLEQPVEVPYETE